MRAAGRRPHDHCRFRAAGPYRIATTLNLVIAVGINEEGSRAYDVLVAAPAEVRFVDRHKYTDPMRDRVDRLDLRPDFIQRPVEDFCVAVSAVTEELESELTCARIEGGEEVGR